MNRLKHLRETMITNIEDNSDFKEIEFILLDYNSTDGLEEYVRNDLTSYIQSQTLFYFRTLEHTYFNRSHSRNLMFKLATGDIICNIDADNYTGTGFATYVNDVFKSDKNCFISTVGNRTRPDVLGRICIHKKDFLKIRGFDERMIHYGFEDYDFIKRIRLLGRKNHVLQNTDFLKVIDHSSIERISNEFARNNIHKILVNYISPVNSRIFLLFKNFSFSFGTLVDNFTKDKILEKKDRKLKTRYNFSILESDWLRGVWQDEFTCLKLKISGNDLVLEKIDENSTTIYKNVLSGDDYYEIIDQKLIDEALFFYSQLSNRMIMENNISNNIIIVNKLGFGVDTVYKNFDNTPMYIR